MITNDRGRRVCEKYSRRDETGRVHCNSCPLKVDAEDLMCKANSHWDRHKREWVPDWVEEEK